MTLLESPAYAVVIQPIVYLGLGSPRSVRGGRTSKSSETEDGLAGSVDQGDRLEQVGWKGADHNTGTWNRGTIEDEASKGRSVGKYDRPKPEQARGTQHRPKPLLEYTGQER